MTAVLLILLALPCQEQRQETFLAEVERMEVACRGASWTDAEALRCWRQLVAPSVPPPSTWGELQVLVDLVLTRECVPGSFAWASPNAPGFLPELAAHPASLAWLTLARHWTGGGVTVPAETGTAGPGHVWAQARVLVEAMEHQRLGHETEARGLAASLVDCEAADPALRDLATRIIRACQPVESRQEARQIAVPGACTAVLFRTAHPHTDHLAEHARALDRLLPSSELEVIEVAVHPDRAPEANGSPGESSVIPATPELRDLAERWGVHVLPQLILLDPRGQAIARWCCSPDCQIYRDVTGEIWPDLIRTQLGYDLAQTLFRIPTDCGWDEFRGTWRAQRGKLPFTISPELLAERLRFLDRPVLAYLLLASECEQPPVIRLPREPDDIHSKLAVAQYRASVGMPGEWDAILGDLRKPSAQDDDLAVLSGIIDLGLISADLPAALVDIAMSSSEWRIVAAALRALAFQETAETPKPLARLGKNRRWQVQLAYAEALRGFRHPDAVTAPIDLLGADRLRIREAAGSSLRILTGAPLRASQILWREWWEQRCSNFLFPRFQSWEQRGSRPAGGDETVSASMFGLQIGSDHILFLVDRSESMRWWRKWEGTMQQLSAFFDMAPAVTRFNLMSFSEESEIWQKRLQALNQKNAGRALRFAQRSPPYGPTDLWSALEAGLGNHNADCLVLVSDGSPNRGEFREPGALLAAAREANRHTRILIHCIFVVPGPCIPYDEKHRCSGSCPPPPDELDEEWMARQRESLERSDPHARFLKALAADTGGEFVIGFGPPYQGLPP